MNSKENKKEVTVKDLMTADVVVAEVGDSVQSAAQKLVENNLTGIPVVKENVVVGIVTEADIIMQEAEIKVPDYVNVLTSVIYLDDPYEVEGELKKILAVSVDDLMTEEVVTVSLDASVSELATLFKDSHANPIPVVDENKILVGIVSRADLVRLFAEQL